MTSAKTIVIGLDCAAPQLVFERWREKLPNVSGLIERGLHGPLRSCVPPVTVPAWSCMMSGKHPGTLGCYGFRNRSDYSYSKLSFATSRAIAEDRVWDILSRNGKNVIVVGVPQTYPPTPVRGCMVSGFLTPDVSCRYTYPDALAGEISSACGGYIIDVDDFRTEDKHGLLKQIYSLTENRFSVFTYLLEHKPWDCAMMVDMGIDRIHHGFWRFMDPEHPRYEPGNPFEDAIAQYYRFVDTKIGEVLRYADDRTAVVVVSDHGARAMTGGFCINEWLMQNGYLRLAEVPSEQVPLRLDQIDWKHTAAWAEGGYFARIFLNVKGREPEGIIDSADYEQVRSGIVSRLLATNDEQEEPICSAVYRPEDVYDRMKGIAPDLMAYFKNLSWRSIGSVGTGTLIVSENDTGPDDANHSEDGICIISDPQRIVAAGSGSVAGMSIVDIAPTLCALSQVPVPEDMEGTVISG